MNNEDCPSTTNPSPADITKMISDYWVLQIINALRDQPLRYKEIERALTGSNPATLCTRLRTLEDAQLVIRSAHKQDKQAVSYQLTPLGKSAIPIIDSINSFRQVFTSSR